jgi:uncharacterized metal-binding protein YceD (DUF177 family)
MTASTIHLLLDDLAVRTGESWEHTYPLEMPPVVLGGVHFEVLIPDGATVVVERVAGRFLVRVSLTATVYGPCARCLREASLRVEAEEEEFAPTAKDGWEESELSEFITDLVVDVSGLARESLVLALPAQIVCSAECRGLCARCGQDLNEAECA